MSTFRFPASSLFRPLVVAAAATLALLTTGPVLGSDGVVEINQTRAEAGGVTPGDTPGFPVTIDTPGSYRLTSNLDVRGTAVPENTTGIEVTAVGVTIDLNGFAILGPVTCTANNAYPTTLSCSPTGGSGTGIAGLDLTGATFQSTRVRNGSIVGMGGPGVIALEVADLSVHSSGGIGIVANKVADSMAFRNGLTGINASHVVDSVVFENGEHGVSGIGLAHRVYSFGNVETGIRANQVQSSSVWGNGKGLEADLLLDTTTNSNTGAGADLDADDAYGSSHFVFNNGGTGNPQVSGGVEIGSNFCDTDTTCP